MGKDAFTFYHSSCRVTAEQVFEMLVSRFGIFWRPIRTRLDKSTNIIAVTCKLHKFIIDHAESDEFDVIALHEENNVQGAPDVYLQNNLFIDT